MARYTVWHKQSTHFMNLNDIELAAFPTGFEQVATVDADHLDMVYRLTNHIESAWWENEGILDHKAGSRSTSVGDVIVDDMGGLWAVDMCGFRYFSPKVAL